jgi:hypothetical protein
MKINAIITSKIAMVVSSIFLVSLSMSGKKITTLPLASSSGNHRDAFNFNLEERAKKVYHP